jgi:serine phosphatase RsbU (regulator of sigma subunit)
LDIELKTYDEQNARQLAEVQTKYETVRNEKEIGDLKMKQISNDRDLNLYKTGLIALFVITGLIVIILITLAAFSRQRKRLNSTLQEKNNVIELQNKKITDSINYAKRIQDSILPEAEEIEKILPQSFVLFQPKDIVSGDFFWLAQVGNKILVAAADCTGHGVPGAFMSMIGNTLLNEIINYNSSLSPSQILTLLNERIARALHQQYGTIQSQDDGMDISLCCIDYAANQIQFAGANHSIYIIQDNEIKETRGDIYSIGGVFAKQKVSFTDKVIPIKKDAMLYLFTDGFKDQFGGVEKLKFKSSRFEKLLLDVYQLPLKDQKEMLHNAFENWKGNLTQLDDVLVTGIRL